MRPDYQETPQLLGNRALLPNDQQTAVRGLRVILTEDLSTFCAESLHNYELSLASYRYPACLVSVCNHAGRGEAPC